MFDSLPPQTRELNKYIDFPVDLSTGIPNISIPLYTIKTQGVEVPINLNYHASGIQEGQEDGEVGLGWSLSCNYRVSRKIYGHPDKSEIQMPEIYTYQNIMYDYEGFQRDRRLGKFISGMFPESLPPREAGLLDGEYDHFSYNFPGMGGMFIISNRTYKTITEFVPTNNRFTYLEGVSSNLTASGIIGFQIKDPSQNLFSYGEQIDKIGWKVLEANNSPLDIANVTAWALTDIDTKFGEKIKFSYNSKINTTKYKKQMNINILEAVRFSFPWEHNINNEYDNSSYRIFSLDRIESPLERVDFEFEDASSNNKIKHIRIYDRNDNSLLTKIDFFYRPLSVSLSQYTFLDSVRIWDSTVTESQSYRFSYYDDMNYYLNIFSNTVLVPDQWGGIKLTSGTRLLHEDFEDDHARPQGAEYDPIRISQGARLRNIYGGSFTDRHVNNLPEIFSLRSITYPAGGKTIYEYEPNKIYISTLWGGIRVKSIRHTDGLPDNLGNEITLLKRDYSYEGGVPAYPISSSDFRREYIYLSNNGSVFLRRRAVAYSTNTLGDLPNNGETHYTVVTEQISGPHQERNGKTVYRFLPVQKISTNSYPVDLMVNDLNMEFYSWGPKHASTYRYGQKPLFRGKCTFQRQIGWRSKKFLPIV